MNKVGSAIDRINNPSWCIGKVTFPTGTHRLLTNKTEKKKKEHTTKVLAMMPTSPRGLQGLILKFCFLRHGFDE